MNRAHGGISRPQPPPGRARCGFTLIETLVVIAIIALLISVVIPAAGRCRVLSRQARELSAAQQLHIAFMLYADDSRGAIMPGYPPAPMVAGPIAVHDHEGARLNGPTAQRYPWRIAPYLDYNFRGLYKDDRILTQLRETPAVGGVDYRYYISLYPTLGLNVVFVGGSAGAGHLGFNAAASAMYGRFYIGRIDDARRPSRLLTFVSARADTLGALANVGPPGGYFQVLPPYLIQRSWEGVYNPDAPSAAANSGHVALRYFGRAVASSMDGHAETLRWDDLQDMTRWADGATRPDWTLGGP